MNDTLINYRCIQYSYRRGKGWNIFRYYNKGASVCSFVWILPLTKRLMNDWLQSSPTDLMKFRRPKCVRVRLLNGKACSCFCLCMCVWIGEAWGSHLWKLNFKKPALLLLRLLLEPLHFNVRCSLHYLWCLTPQNHGLPPSTSLSPYPHSNHNFCARYLLI